VAESFSRLTGVPIGRLQVIYNGLPGNEIRQLAAEPLPDEHEQIFAAPTIVTAGRLDEVKGQHYLVQAHAELRSRGFAQQLVILGEGPRGEDLRRLAEELGVSGSVHFLGFQQNPYRYMRRASVFALSSILEGLGLVLGEAMFCGAPVVSFDCPTGPREVLADGRYGMLVPPRDSGALADALGRILGDGDERARYVALSAERCEAFDVSLFIGEWANLLERNVQGVSGRAVERA
jgi:glycosyltransferase involved in cell wall biosynthesis